MVTPPFGEFMVATSILPSPLKSAVTPAGPGAGNAGSCAIATELVGVRGVCVGWARAAAHNSSAHRQRRREDFISTLRRTDFESCVLAWIVNEVERRLKNTGPGEARRAQGKSQGDSVAVEFATGQDEETCILRPRR